MEESRKYEPWTAEKEVAPNKSVKQKILSELKNGMMRLFIFGLIIPQITVPSWGENLQQKPPEIDGTELLKASESRYHSNSDYRDRDSRNYNNRITRKDFDLPITFKAPHYEAHDYWRSKQNYDNRRTFFDDYSYKTTTFPDFYQFMTSFFGGRDEPPERYHYPRNPTPPPYSFDPPLSFQPTEPNYIPPPKPIRASVIKLETITRSPIYPSFEYETTPKYYPHPGSLLNHVLIENSKAQEPKIPPFKPLPVLPKPGYVSPTTLKPNNPFLNNHNLKDHNKSDYKYPESVQDQLPHFDLEEVKIPYVSEKPNPQIFNTISTEASPQSPFGFSGNVFRPSNSRTTTNILDLIDVRSLNSPVGKRERHDFETTTVKSFPGAVEKIKRPTFKFTKKLTAQLDKSSVERVANLTVEGFSKSEKENDNLAKHIKYVNVRDLINYEMGRFDNLSRFSPKQTTNDSAKRLVNLNDELSLDAKILKDTNWDGLAVLPTSSTTEETTTLRVIQTTETEPRNKTAFWEFVGEQTTEITTEVTTTTEPNSIRTTELPWPSTPEVTETRESTTTEEGTSSPEETHRRSESTTQLITETPEIDSTTQSVRTTSARRYSRRPKVVNFTPYPTAEEIQKKLLNRNHFPKRQKPNITLTFGNKNVLKTRTDFGKDEIMKFSEEEVRRRRKIGKRRQVIKRVRVATSERPFQN